MSQGILAHRRNNALDGLRAIAVVSVFAFHLFPASVPGGFLGVDIFFVLSGFLITSLLLREKVVDGGVSLKNFWLRRARRILPAAFSVMAVSCAAALLVSADLRVGLWQQVLGILTFTTNWVQILTETSYFESQIPQLFLHYWSLAIEEQFYVLWPLALIGLLWLLRAAKSTSRRALLAAIILAAALGSAALMWAGFTEGTDSSPIYFGTHTHAFGLLIGAALAVATSSQNTSKLASRWSGSVFPWRSDTAWTIVSSLAGIVILAAFFVMNDKDALAYKGGIFVICLATALLIAAAALGKGALIAPLSHPAMVWVGRRSYSMYLWHWPVFIIAGQLFDDSPEQAQSGFVAVLTIALVTLLSHLSYQWIELPFQRYGYSGVAELVRRQDTEPKPVTARAAAKAAPPAKGRLLPVGAAALSAAMVAVTAIGAYSVTTAPTKTSIQEQLEAAEGQSATASASNEIELPPEPQPLPAGGDISVIGDSVALGATEAFTRAFPGMDASQVNAEVSRSFIAVPGILQELAAAGVERDVIIIAMGANGPAGAEYIDSILDEIGPDRLVVVMNSHSSLPVNADINAGIVESVANHPNAEMGDWNAAISDRTDLLAADDVHPAGEEGRDLYAQVAKSALQRLVDRRAATG